MNDDQAYETESTLNFRAAAALGGDLVVDGTTGIADALCELLRSPHSLSRDVRERLACAIERGRSGYRSPSDSSDHLVRIMVEDFGPNSGLFSAVLVRRNWLAAADDYVKLRDLGRARDAAMVEAGTPFGLGYESMRKQAIKFRDALWKEYDDANSLIHRQVSEYGFTYDTEDYEHCFSSIFVEREAERTLTIQPIK